MATGPPGVRNLSGHHGHHATPRRPPDAGPPTRPPTAPASTQRTPLVKVDICSELHGERRAAAWALYSAAFDELDALAIQRHLMTREEFAAVAGDSRILKYCAITDDGAL